MNLTYPQLDFSVEEMKRIEKGRKIRAMVEQKERELGRPLTPTEIVGIKETA